MTHVWESEWPQVVSLLQQSLKKHICIDIDIHSSPKQHPIDMIKECKGLTNLTSYVLGLSSSCTQLSHVHSRRSTHAKRIPWIARLRGQRRKVTLSKHHCDHAACGDLHTCMKLTHALYPSLYKVQRTACAPQNRSQWWPENCQKGYDPYISH